MSNSNKFLILLTDVFLIEKLLLEKGGKEGSGKASEGGPGR